MDLNKYTPAMRELMAKNILLSMGGNIYPRPGELLFDVTDENDITRKKDVTSIHYTPGYEHEGYYLYFNNGFAYLKEESQRQKVWAYILNRYPLPDKNSQNDETSIKDKIALREKNLAFIAQHGDLDSGDMAMIDAYRKYIEKARELIKSKPEPLPGDIIEGAYYDGAFPFKRGIIESCPHHEKQISVCAQPYVPFIHFRNNKKTEIRLSVSGGPFFGFNTEDLEYIGPDERLFQDWGHCGPCAGGAVSFSAKVNRWRIRNNVKY